MICNHYVLITNSGSNRELPTIISVKFTDWLIPNMEFFCFEVGGGISPLSYSVSSVALAGSFLMTLDGCVFFLVYHTPCED